MNEKKVVTMEEAAQMLGFKTTRSIHNLVKKRKLSVFKFAHRSKTPYISVEQIEALLVPIEVKSREVVENGAS
tara:strand:- start:88 stop:306 length:219 start_codon:yes stop_codon:yes gene_type:complete